jgi:uncharacterized protein YggE
MKLSRILSSLLLMFAAVCAFGQQAARDFQSNTVYVGADGKFEAAPDTAVINFNIGAQEPVLKDAYARAQRAAEQIRQTLTANGIDPKEAQISSFQVSPVYDWKNPKRKLVAYQVGSSITVKVKDFSKVGPIAESFANMDVTENQSISYALENMDAAKAKAIEDAYTKAKANAEVIVRLAGHHLGPLVYSTVDVSEPGPMPRPMMMSYSAKAAMAPGAAPTEEFSPQEITVTAHVNALFGMQ